VAFPRSSEIFRGDMRDIRDSVARPSLDTYYQVNFSFGNFDKWLSDVDNASGPNSAKRTQARGFQRKMSLLCTQAEIPGTSFVESTVVGHHQGIQESFPQLRNYPPLNLVFYVDADHVVLEVLETWMSYINPIQTNQRNINAYSRFNYPDDYKEIIHLSKFERDTFIDDRSKGDYSTRVTNYEFVNVWPSNLTSMRLAYGDSNVLKCNIQFLYDRFFTSFHKVDNGVVPTNTPVGIVNSDDIAQTVNLKEPNRSDYGTNRNEQGSYFAAEQNFKKKKGRDLTNFL